MCAMYIYHPLLLFICVLSHVALYTVIAFKLIENLFLFNEF
jgi:hypothetical protein